MESTTAALTQKLIEKLIAQLERFENARLNLECELPCYDTEPILYLFEEEKKEVAILDQIIREFHQAEIPVPWITLDDSGRPIKTTVPLS